MQLAAILLYYATVNEGDENWMSPIDAQHTAHRRYLRNTLVYVTSLETAHRPLNHSVVYIEAKIQRISRLAAAEDDVWRALCEKRQ